MQMENEEALIRLALKAARMVSSLDNEPAPCQSSDIEQLEVWKEMLFPSNLNGENGERGPAIDYS
jgi:hypothetical protein